MSTQRPIRVLHVITSLSVGGAERQLQRLVMQANQKLFEMHVLSLIDGGPIAEELVAAGVPVTGLGMRSPAGILTALPRLWASVRTLRPQVIHGWMYHGNVMACFSKWAMRNRVPMIWGIRHSLHYLDHEKPLTRATIRLGAILSGCPEKVVYNAETAKGQHEAIGYQARSGETLPNGFDTDRWRPDPAARHRVRAELGLAESTRLVGLIARFDPIKDHANFLTAAEKIALQRNDVHFVMVGRGVIAENPALAIENYPGLVGRLHCLGERSDIPNLTAALDVAVSASHSEGFSNAIGEGMSCGIPCVATDVGDSARIVNDTGAIVPPSNSMALAGAIEMILNLSPIQHADLGARARTRVLENYSIEAIVDRYQNLYEMLLARSAS